MRILTLTTLYPHEAAPYHGVFVENRLCAYRDRHGGEFRVIAPVPWFPVSATWAGRYGTHARAPVEETRRGIHVLHPRYAIPPKVGMTYAATALERCFFRAAREQMDQGFDFDLIDAHYLYPDGVAAVRVARKLRKPVIVTARGTDVNLLPQYPRQREMILEAVRNADAIVCVAAALKDELVRLGAPAEKISVLRNGVDLKMFRPLDRDALRRSMGLAGDVIASVGHLTERKGHNLVLESLSQTHDAMLLIAGAGEEREALERQAAAAGLSSRVRFLGSIAHDNLAEVYNAADVLALASSREGWPNVLLEAMACGTPAVATPVWGSREVIREPAAGMLSADRSAAAIGAAIRAVLGDRPSRTDTRRYAERFNWDETSDGLRGVVDAVTQKHAGAHEVALRRVKLAATKPKLLVTVDTEERFDWAAAFGDDWRVCPPADIDRFQQTAQKFGAAPIYFLTYPVIDDAASAAYFGSLAQKGAAALGLHLHQWVTPPLGGYAGAYYSYQYNLPADVHAAKLEALAETFERAFGFRARSHRAGRYGISRAAYRELALIGIDLDFSPSPCFDFSRDGGPNFTDAANRPFEVDVQGHRPIYTTPVSGGVALRGGRTFLKRAKDGLNLESLAPTAALTAPARLTCEGVRFSEVRALTQRLVDDGETILTFSLHSTTLSVGANPYAKSAADIDRSLDFCSRYFDFFKNEMGGEFLALEELERLYASATLTRD